MITRALSAREKEVYNQCVNHPCQTWEWGEFREKTGAAVVRVGDFDQEKLVSGYQISFHRLPFSQFTIGYLPRGPLPNQAMIASLKNIGQERKTIFFRIEPNVTKREASNWSPLQLGLTPSSRPFFYRYTYLLDLTKNEAELLKGMKQKTRYNLRLAQRRGVKISQDNGSQAFETYLRLLKETTQRQHFFAHTPDYHRRMWQTLSPVGMAHLLKGEYQGQVLAVWILFHFHDILYYPYGASSSTHRHLMANNLMAWEAIRLGKKLGCQTFDFWGCLGPNANPADPWYGFHRFKEGYGGKLVELVGSFDLVLEPRLYKLYHLVDNCRWQLLNLRIRLG